MSDLMPSRNDETALCPVGETDCPRIGELLGARAEAAELAELVHTDALTGLFNYRHFVLAMEQEQERTRRSGQPTSLVMVDLDHFKKINDQRGHESGNRVLHHCGELIAGLVRRIDLPCRYGGEEFALILPGTPLPQAVNAAERLRVAIEQSSLEFDGCQLRVTASMGVDVFVKGDRLSMKAFVERADGFLFQAKAQGRNRVCHPDFALYRPSSQVGKEEKEALFKP